MQSLKITIAMDETVAAVEEGSKMQAQAVSEATIILDQLNMTINQIAKGAQEQADNMGQAAGMVHEMVTSVKEVSSSTYQLQENNRYILETTEQLAGMAENLKGTVDKFKV